MAPSRRLSTPAPAHRHRWQNLTSHTVSPVGSVGEHDGPGHPSDDRAGGRRPPGRRPARGAPPPLDGRAPWPRCGLPGQRRLVPRGRRRPGDARALRARRAGSPAPRHGHGRHDRRRCARAGRGRDGAGGTAGLHNCPETARTTGFRGAGSTHLWANRGHRARHPHLPHRHAPQGPDRPGQRADAARRRRAGRLGRDVVRARCAGRAARRPAAHHAPVGHAPRLRPARRGAAGVPRAVVALHRRDTSADRRHEIADTAVALADVGHTSGAGLLLGAALRLEAA